MKGFLAIVLVLAAPLLVLGCGKDNPAKPGYTATPFVYPDRSTPDNTLRRMAAAVSRRDTVVMASVYDETYVGSSIDVTDVNPTTLTFLKSDEIRAVGEMARSSSISFVEFDLGNPSTWIHTHYGTDPVGWVTIQVPHFSATVVDGADAYSVRSSTSGEMYVFEFTLNPTAPDPSSPTDTTWTIIRWMEHRAPI